MPTPILLVHGRLLRKLLRSILALMYQCWRVTSRVADQYGYGGLESPGPLSLFWLCVALFGNMQPKLAPGEPGREKKETEAVAGHDERACLGGPQAAGKRHSQPFRAKRLPHPRVVSGRCKLLA